MKHGKGYFADCEQPDNCRNRTATAQKALPGIPGVGPGQYSVEEQGVFRMITTVDAAKHRVYVRLTRAESADSRVAEQLDALFAQCRGTKERVFVFRSGERDLVDCTAGLLRHNREVQARTETR